MKKRLVMAVLLVLGAAMVALPSAEAAQLNQAETDADEDLEGLKYCKRVQGRYVCTAYEYRGCTFWLSVGFGGCWIS